MKKALLLSVLAFHLQFVFNTASAQRIPTSVYVFHEHALPVAWDRSGSNRIAYAAENSKGYYNIHLSNPDGSNDTCITCNSPLLPPKHIAIHDWYPSGKWLLITAEKPVHDGGSYIALPGFGAYNDIWLIDTGCTKAYKLFDVPADIDHGVLMPHFSHDGKHIIWTNRKVRPSMLVHGKLFGYWAINIADFAFDADSIPHLTNIRTLSRAERPFMNVMAIRPTIKASFSAATCTIPQPGTNRSSQWTPAVPTYSS